MCSDESSLSFVNIICSSFLGIENLKKFKLYYSRKIVETSDWNVRISTNLKKLVRSNHFELMILQIDWKCLFQVNYLSWIWIPFDNWMNLFSILNEVELVNQINRWNSKFEYVIGWNWPVFCMMNIKSAGDFNSITKIKHLNCSIDSSCS